MPAADTDAARAWPPSESDGDHAPQAGTSSSDGATGRTDPEAGGAGNDARADAAAHSELPDAADDGRPDASGEPRAGPDASPGDVDASADAASTSDASATATSDRTVCSTHFRTDESGNSGFGSSGPRQQRRVHIDRSGNVVITGTFIGTVFFGNARLSAQGVASYVAKVDADCQLLWAKSFGGDPDSRLQFEAVSSDSAGNIYAGGTLEGVVDLGDPLSSLERNTPVLVKLSSNGDLLWSRAYGSVTYDGALSGIEVDSEDRVVLSGVASADTSFGGGPVGFGRIGPVAFVAKLDGAAAHLWSRSPTTLMNLDAALGPDDSVAMSGFDPTRGFTTHQLGMLDASGSEVWSNALTSRLMEGLGRWEGDLAVDAEGNILMVTAYEHSDDQSTTLRREATLQKFTASGEPIWSVDVPVGANLDTTSWDGSLDCDASGHVLYSIGFSEPTTFGGQTFEARGNATDNDDLLLMKLTPDGEPVWMEQIGDDAHDTSYGLDADSQGNIVTAYLKAWIGEFRSELWVVKLAP